MSTSRVWRFIDSGAALAAVNMALDEELLAKAATEDVLPVLRFYAWDPAAVSIGRFQKKQTAVNEDACKKLGIDIVRRITGGRAVLHHNELTYSIISRTDNTLFPNSVLGTYKVIAGGLLAGLNLLGISAEMVSRSGRHAGLVNRNSDDHACFSSPSWYEILANGRKIVGSAQRRMSTAFLQQGSILIDYDPALEAQVIPGNGAADVVTSIQRELGREVSSDEVKQAFRKGFAQALGMELNASIR